MLAEKHQRLCIWLGLALFPSFCIGLMIAGFFVPPAPSMDANAVAQMFEDNRTGIRIGVWILTAASPLLAFFVAALSHQVRCIHGGASPLITAQTVAGACLILEFIFPQMIWQTAAYRVERSPELVQMMLDMGWLMYVGVVGTAIAQMLIMALAIFQDPREQPLIPRWCAYLCCWSAVGVAGGGFCVFVKTGMLAWNGLIAWWLLMVSFFAWMAGLCWQMWLASRRAEAAERAGGVV